MDLFPQDASEKRVGLDRACVVGVNVAPLIASVLRVHGVEVVRWDCSRIQKVVGMISSRAQAELALLQYLAHDINGFLRYQSFVRSFSWEVQGSDMVLEDVG
jgi:hypothetical protein